jgi:uncharacterized repeat protein (TIGR01451 family)
LAPNATITCTGTHTVTQADLDAGKFDDTACANATGAQQVCADDTVPASQNPHLAITKSANPTTYNAAGQVITYTIVATNDGNVTLSGVTVTDNPALDGFSCVPPNGSSLAPGDSMTCTGTHTITQADVDAGHFDDVACVDDGDGGAAEQCAPNTVTGEKNPQLAITKSASPTTYNAVGQVITYTIVATNTGNTTLTNVTVSDPNISGLTCTPANCSSLAPGDSMTCSATHTITQADLDAGHYANTACVNDGPGGAAQACASANVTGQQNPSLTLDKTSTTTLITAAGQVVPYSYVITNTGNVTLTGVTLTGDKVAPASITCNPAQPATLAPNATMTCTGSHTVTQAEFDAGGNLVNIATADSDQTSPVTDTVSIPIQPPVKGHIMHTGVTCSDFVSNNPSDELTDAFYGVKSGQVNSVSPGVMFYYISITAPSASFTVNVTQSNDKSWKPIPVAGVNQIILYNADCSKSNKGTPSFNSTNGTATLTVSGATAGATYIAGIKYSLSGLAGQAVSSPFPVVTYSFASNFNGGSNIPSSQDSIKVNPK